LPHYEYLVGFLDKYLKEDISLFEQYKAGTKTTVTFENLWMLFDVGETIFCPARRGDATIPNPKSDKDDDSFKAVKREVPQAFRVLGTLGGVRKWDVPTTYRPSIEESDTPTADSDTDTKSQFTAGGYRMKDRYVPLWIDCFCIYFNGSKFIPALDAFELKPFDGEVDITSLEVFPARFRATEEDSKGTADLVERGEAFADMTTIRHKRYRGVTLTDDKGHKEEVSRPNP
jgi:hypothetical protein